MIEKIFIIAIIGTYVGISFSALSAIFVKWIVNKYPPKRIQYRFKILEVVYVPLMDMSNDLIQEFHKWNNGRNELDRWQFGVKYEYFSSEPYEGHYRTTVNACICVPAEIWDLFLAQRKK